MHRKLRSRTTAVLLAVVGCLVLPAAASAKISITGIPVSDGSDSMVEPGIAPAPDGSNAEWVTVSGTRQELVAVTPSGKKSTVVSGLASDAGPPDNYVSVNAEGYEWIIDNDQGLPENVLYAVGASDTPNPGLNVVATFNGYAEDMTLGPDGALYISDNGGNLVRCQITDTPSAACAAVPIGYPFDGGAYALGSSGQSVWFTDAGGDLGSYASTSGAVSPSGSFSGSFRQVNDVDPGTIVPAGNGLVYVAGGAAFPGAANTEILEFSSGGTYEGVAASGLGNVVSMTLGPDGNLWFLDAGGNGSVDQLNIATGVVTSYALPSGLHLPQGGWRIAAGPSVPSTTGTGEVFFTGTSAATGGTAEIGEVEGIPFPVAPGSLVFKPVISVSKQRRAILTMTCGGLGNSQCNGRILVSVRAKVKVEVEVRSARKGGRARFRLVTQTKRVALGSVRYALIGGKTSRVTLTLSNSAYQLLEQAAGHHWNATVTSAATTGTVTGTELTMTGPPPPKPKSTAARSAKPKKHRG